MSAETRTLPMPVPSVAPRPLVVVADERVLEEVLRLCAAVDVSPQVATDVAAARRSWSAAPLVVLDVGLAPALLQQAPGRREGVHLLAREVDDRCWRLAVALGAEAVHRLPGEEDGLAGVLATGAEPAGDDGTVLALVGGSGGVGTTTLATAVAVTAARDGTSTLLVDLDPLGGGIDLAVGSEDAQGLRWADLAGTRGRVGAGSLRDALPRDPVLPTLSVLAWDRDALPRVPPDAVRSVLAAARRSHGLVVVDLARRVEETAQEALLAAHQCVLVAAADVRGVAAAARTLGAVRDHVGAVGVLVREQGPGGLAAELVARTLEVPLVGVVGPDRRVAAALDDGLGPLAHRRSPVARSARTLVGLLPLARAER